MSHHRVSFFGRTGWTDAPHFPCLDPGSCPYGHGNLPRPGSDSTLFGLRHDDRRRHMILLGASGMGKTTMLRNLLVADIAAGHGVALLDPHGDLANDLVSAIPPSRTRSTVYFDPSDLAYPIGLNVFESVDPDYHFLVADQLIAVFRNIWKDSWGPRMEYIFHSAVLSLLHVEGSTLLCVPRILTDKRYRAWVTSQLEDEVLKRFWTHEYETLSPTLQREASLPILNKVGQFLNAPVLRRIIGQRWPKLDVGEIMDGSCIFIANLSKGRIGEHNSMLLGSLLLTKFFLAALRRADRPEHERVDFFLTADELHHLASGDMLASILSEARKYHLSITGAFQYLNALSPTIRSAIFGNVGTILAFRVGAEDAHTLASEFAPHCQPADLQTLGRHAFYVKLAVNGVATRPFLAVAVPPLTLAFSPQTRERIIRSSRERYGARREVVEAQISRWLAHTPGKRPGPDAATSKQFVVT
jgi:hypothetical protein